MDRIDKPKSEVQQAITDEVRISVPWSIEGSSNVYQGIGRANREDANHFISERSRVHETYIREQEKTRRLSLVLATISFIAGCVVIVFGPAERETLSNWIGAALLVVSAGAAGYKRVWGRTKEISFGADHRNNHKGA